MRRTVALLLMLLAAPARGEADLVDWTNSWLFNLGDESVLVMPTFARPGADGAWHIRLRGVVFELEADSAKRKAIVRGIAAVLGVDDDSEEYKLLSERMTWLLVDHESRKRVRLKAGPRIAEFGPTGLDGTFGGEVVVPAAGPSSGGPIRLHYEGRDAAGHVLVPCVPAEGWSVISDVDDTIKITEVLDRATLIANTFLKPFAAVPGMAGRYAEWARKGVFFHYVSASPEQLLPPLQGFAAASGLPFGSWHLRNVHWSHGTDLAAMVKAPESYKLDIIDDLVAGQPGRRFVLIGDSGERDPEVYGEIARRHPDQVRQIWIRRVPGANNADARFAVAFRDVPADRWRAFEDAHELPVALGEP